MQIIDTSEQSMKAVMMQLRGERSSSEETATTVRSIIDRVKNDGDQALLELTKQFDGATLPSLAVSSKEIAMAIKRCPPELLKALKKAKSTITQFHKTTYKKKENPTWTTKGVKLWREFRPIEKVGLYVPGGLAAYPSTVLMLGVPAQIAGCEEIVMCVPADRYGTVPDATLVAASLCGIEKMYKLGGAQAIAAMALGTKTIPKVYKILGPGNQYVATAKMQLYGEVDIDMPAGPSEIMIVADETMRADFIAADFLSQLEHGGNSQAVLITFSKSFALQVQSEVTAQAKLLGRSELIKASLEKSFIVVTSDQSEAVKIANEYGPEHLEIMLSKRAKTFAAKVINAGSVFIGPYSSESLGDYCTGANHTLPTAGFAKMFNPLSVSSFGKMIQFQEVSRTGATVLGPTGATIAYSEGLDAHARAIEIRYQPII